MLFSSVKDNLQELTDVLEQLSAAQYSDPCEELSGASIGGHYRHIIEIFLCLLENYDEGNVNYDLRERNKKIETDPTFALEKIASIKNSLEKKNKPILLEQTLQEEKLLIESNYFRELLYNLEHAIHHQALIKIGIQSFGTLQLTEDFGVAGSTIAYRKQCAQ